MVNWNKLALIHKTERSENMAKAEDMNGGLSGSKPEFHTYKSRIEALKALEAKLK